VRSATCRQIWCRAGICSKIAWSGLEGARRRKNPREANHAQAAAALEKKIVQLNQKMEKKEKELSERIESLNVEKEQ
jgi:hypothetical protein